MSGAAAEALALVLLAAVLAFAVRRPRGLPEAVAAVPAAALLLAVGALSLHDAGEEARRLGSTLGFLAAVLVLGALCEREGLFAAAGRLLARGAHGEPRRLLALVFAVAAAVTVALSLDATVVLLTPVVFASARAARVRARPHLYACAHLANAASLLLPISNLTNLLAFHATGIGFLRFAGLMALPWAAAIAVEWVVFRWFFAGELGEGASPVPPAAPVAPAAGAAAGPAAPAATGAPTPSAASAVPAASAAPLASAAPVAAGAPRLAVGVVVATLAGFAACSPLGIDPALVATAGALALALPALAAGRTSPGALVRAASPGFLLFVLALGLVVVTAQRHGLADQLGHVLPHGDGLLALLGVAGIAALLANAVNNLPAILILLPVLAAAPDAGVGPVLAALIGVGIGPNLTYAGSLATLLWRRQLCGSESEPRLAEFVRLGAVTVPLGLVAATLALWVGLGGP